MRRVATLLLSLMATGAFMGPAGAGDPAPDALDRWIAEAKARGEPTTWEELLGEPAPEQDNGVSRLVPALWAIEGRVSKLRGDPAPRWQEDGATLARALVEAEPAYFGALRQAGKAPHFRPRVSVHALGSLVPDDAYALRAARQAMDCLAAIGGDEAAEAMLWLLRTQGKWVPRSWAEGRQWDSGLRDLLGVVARVAGCRRVVLPTSAAWMEMDAALVHLERTLLASIRSRLLARRLSIVEMARDLLSGRDVIKEAAERMERLAKQLDEIWGGGRPGETPLALPKVPAPGTDVPDYVHDHEALLRDTFVSLDLFALALETAGDVPSMRVAAEAGPKTRQGLAAGMEFGEFAYVLDHVAQLRLARIALVLVRDRVAGRPGAEALHAILAREWLWDPVSGLPFVARVEARQVRLVRQAIPPRTTASDAPARLTVVYPEPLPPQPR